MSNNFKNNEKDSKSKQSEENKLQKFTVQTYPKDNFKLFARDDENIDSYIWEKRFYNTLPKLSIPPKSFNFNLSHEALCNFNMPTVMFSLKQFNLLTDSKMNTSINKELIEKSINYIFPNVDIYNSNRLNYSSDATFKKEILSIIESRDDAPIETKQKFKNSAYSRQFSMITSSINVNKKYVIPTKPDFNKNEENEAKNSDNNIIANINKSFETVKKVKEGFKHPLKPNVVAKNVYEVQPFFQFLNHKFSEVMYPSDYEINNENKTIVLKLNKNDQQEDEKIFSGYSKDKNEEVTPEEHLYLKKSLNFERHFSYKLANSNEIFNTGLFLIDKESKKSYYTPLNKKFILQKYKKHELNIDKDDDNIKYISKKRNRNLHITPVGKSNEVINARNQIFKSNRMLMEYYDNNEEVEEKVRELDSKYNDRSSNNLFDMDDNEIEHEHEEEIEDFFVDQKDNF